MSSGNTSMAFLSFCVLHPKERFQLTGKEFSMFREAISTK